MFCTKCGTQLKETQKFCVKCGTKAPVKTALPPPAPQPQAQSPGPTQTAVPPLPPPRREAVEHRVASPPPPLAPAASRPAAPTPVTVEATGRRSLLWLWVGVTIIVLGAGGFFAYRHLHAGTTSRATATLLAGPSTGPPSTPTQPVATASNIRRADFRNFEYHSDALGKTVRVTKGGWTDPSTGEYFGIAKVAYGDLKGDGGEEAVVWTESAPGGMSPNVHEAEVFVFVASSSGPRLLASLWSSDAGKGEQVDWGRLTGISIGARDLSISYSEGECNACNDWALTSTFAWNGNRFVRTGLTRKPYAEQSATASGPGPRQAKTAQVSPNATKPKPQATWGFNGPQGSTPTPTKPAGATTQAAVPPPVPLPPPAPKVEAPTPPQPVTVLVPAGTSVVVATIDPIDSEKNHAGDIFHASLAAPVVVNNQVIVPQDTDIYLRALDIRSAGHFKGISEVRLVLDHLVFKGQTYPLSSSDFDVDSSSRGKQTAERVGGGAAVGAIIGAIAGGGKGAAVGAGAGAGAGTVAQIITKGKQIHIPSETKITFQLLGPVTFTYTPAVTH